MTRRSARTAGQLAALFVADPLTGAPGVGIDPDENGDQLDLFGAVAEVEAEAAALVLVDPEPAETRGTRAGQAWPPQSARYAGR